MNEKLLALLGLIAAVVNSADHTGCSVDLTVVSRSALEDLHEFAITNFVE